MIVLWAYYATKLAQSAEDGGWPNIPYKRDGNAWLEDVYKRSKLIVDHLTPVFKYSMIRKRWREDRPQIVGYQHDKDIYANLYQVSDDALIFQDKKLVPHPFRGRYVFVGFNVNLTTKDFDFDLRHQGKTNIKNLSLFSPSGQAEYMISGSQLKTTLPAVFPFIAVFDMD